MNRVHLLSFDFLSGEFNEVLSEIREGRYDDRRYVPFLITPNADQVLQFNRNKSLAALSDFYKRSYFILPDGMPIVLFSKLIKTPLGQRLAGSDLFPRFWSFIKEEKKRLLVVTPTEHVGVSLQKENPSIRYYVPAFLKIDDHEAFLAETNAIVSIIQSYMPDYIMIGLGFPKQEMLGKLLYEKISSQHKAPLFLLLGASFEFYLGIKRRAPHWMQKSGLEWLHRLCSEPKRLWKRYTIGNVKFLMFFLSEYWRFIQKGSKD